MLLYDIEYHNIDFQKTILISFDIINIVLNLKKNMS